MHDPDTSPVLVLEPQKSCAIRHKLKGFCACPIEEMKEQFHQPGQSSHRAVYVVTHVES